MSALLTPADVAARWACTPEHVQRLCASKALPAMKLGSRGWRVALEAVEAYEAAHSNASAPDGGGSAARNIHPMPPVASCDVGAEYEPVVRGRVPWRSTVIDQARPASRRAAGKTKARSARP